MTAWAAILFCALPRDVLLVWEPKNPKNCLKYANTNVLSIVYIYIKAKPAPNSASDWPPSWFCALPETSCLSGSRKTPKTAQKNPFLTRNGTISVVRMWCACGAHASNMDVCLTALA